MRRVWRVPAVLTLPGTSRRQSSLFKPEAGRNTDMEMTEKSLSFFDWSQSRRFQACPFLFRSLAGTHSPEDPKALSRQMEDSKL